MGIGFSGLEMGGFCTLGVLQEWLCYVYDWD